MFNELTSTTKDLNCTTKRNNSEIIEQHAAIEDLIEAANMFSKKIKELKVEIMANSNYTFEFLDKLAFKTTGKKVSEEIESYESRLKRL